MKKKTLGIDVQNKCMKFECNPTTRNGPKQEGTEMSGEEEEGEEEEDTRPGSKFGHFQTRIKIKPIGILE